MTAPVARHPNAELIARFYAAFGRRDAAAMNICYHPAATFSDPLFPDLDHAGVTAMWRMLCERGKDLQVTATGIEGDGESGRAHWDATYTYTGSGRRVLNRIDATFTFRDGLIVRHVDRFDLARWMRQALGLRGLLIGWLPPAQRAVRTQGAKALARYRGAG